MGDALLRLGENPEADDLVFQQLNSYRSLFNKVMLPVNTACRNQATRRLKANEAKKVIVVQRIKRLDSITAKLNRFPSMQLSQMQDIGGLRVILPSIGDVEIYTKNLLARSKKIKIKGMKNYIASPKEDGYRGIHYILELENNATDVVPFPTLLVELQVRTQVQHIWATGVEIAAIINNKNYKTGDWDADWKESFILLSHLCALLETMDKNIDTFGVDFDNIKKSTEILLKKIDSFVTLARKTNLAKKFNSFSKVLPLLVKEIKQKQFKHTELLLLITDFELNKTEVTAYTDEKLALDHLTVWEKRFSSSSKQTGQAVLVSAKDILNLKEAYPNYYMDTNPLQELWTDIQHKLSLYKQKVALLLEQKTKEEQEKIFFYENQIRINEGKLLVLKARKKQIQAKLKETE
ncbi:MAG: hypothetical protein H2174_03825 [Vampirovibrio sp.]|nr:hypothetical protein [Vampirovibrio sp.]